MSRRFSLGLDRLYGGTELILLSTCSEGVYWLLTLVGLGYFYMDMDSNASEECKARPQFRDFELYNEKLRKNWCKMKGFAAQIEK